MFSLPPAKGKHYCVCLRREVVSIPLIAKGNLALPGFPTKRTLPVSLIGLDTVFLWFSTDYYKEDDFQSSICWFFIFQLFPKFLLLPIALATKFYTA